MASNVGQYTSTTLSTNIGVFRMVKVLRAKREISPSGAGVSIKQKAIRRWNEVWAPVLGFQCRLDTAVRTNMPCQKNPSSIFILFI